MVQMAIHCAIENGKRALLYDFIAWNLNSMATKYI